MCFKKRPLHYLCYCSPLSSFTPICLRTHVHQVNINSNVCTRYLICILNVQCCPDIDAPTILGCPGNTAQPTDPVQSTAVVSWTDPTAVDNADPYPAISCTPVSGSEFAVGITEVVCKATDANENKAVCQFNVVITGW